MEPAAAFLELGFSLAAELLADPAAGTGADGGPYIERSAARLEAAAEEAGRAAEWGAHGERLEELVSRTRNLARLASLGRPDQVLQYAMLLRESVDHARNRAEEGELHWLGAHLAGYSAYLAGLRFSGSASDAETGEFRRAVQEAKARVLDHGARELVAAGEPLPWAEIARFVTGDDPAPPRALLARMRGTGRASSAAGGGAADPASRDRIAALVSEELAGTDSVYVWPAIPAEKLAGAEKKLLSRAPAGEEPVALIDVTVFGGAADGVAVFSSGFVYGDIGVDGVWVEYASLRKLPALDGSRVLVDDLEVKLYRGDRARAFAGFLVRVFADVHGIGAPD